MPQVINPTPLQPFAIILADSKEKPASVEESLIVSLYKEHGAIILRGFDIDLSEFRQFARRYCSSSVVNESSGRILLDEESNIQTVNLGDDAFPLHPELSRDPWQPDACFFWCISPPPHGGETLICDGIEIVRSMPQEIFDALEKRRLLYAQIAYPEHCEFWLGSAFPDDETLQCPPTSCPYEFFRAEGKIVRAFSRPTLHRPMFADELAFGNFLLFARYYLNAKSFPIFENREIVPDDLVAAIKDISDAVAVPIQWHRGDLLMLDNTRFMHGRNTIKNPRERQIASYFGYLKFAVPGAEEPVDAPWRRPGFRAPERVRTARH